MSRFQYLLYCAAVLSVLFPWSPRILPFSDLQPLPAFFAFLYLSLFVRKIPMGTWTPILTFIFSFIVFILFYSDPINGLRGVYPYFIFMALVIVEKHFRESMPDVKVAILYFCTAIWFGCGIMQFIYPNFMHAFVSREAVTAFSQTRGASSLAPEPTFYALQLFLFACYIYAQFSAKRIGAQDYYLLQLITLLQILLFSRSALVLLICFLIFVFAVLLYWPRYSIVIPIGFITIESFGPTRLAKIFSSFPDIMILDHSSSDRLSHIVYSFYYAISEFFVPHGFDSWQSIDAAVFSGYIPFNSIPDIPRILSMFGSIVYELGFLGVPLLIYLLYVPAFYFPETNKKKSVLIVLVTIFVGINAVPLALPIIGLIYGSLLSMAKKSSSSEGVINESIIQQ